MFIKSGQRFNGAGLRGEPVARMLSFGLLWFYMTLMIESSIFPIVDPIFEHRLYLPSVGFMVAFAALAELLARKSSIKIVSVVMICLITAFCVATINRNEVWGDALTLWQDVVSKSPNKDRAHYNLSAVLRDRNRLPESLQQLNKAISLHPDNDLTKIQMLTSLATLYEKMGETDLAIEKYEEIIKFKSDDPIIYSDVANLYGKKGMIDKAIEYSLAALRINPDMALAHKNLGTAYLVNGDTELSKRHLEEAIRINPYLAEVHNNLGVMALREGNRAVALGYFKKAVELKPENSDYNRNLAIAQQDR
jgi:tetratricopeptide (TPR) repeat protein